MSAFDIKIEHAFNLDKLEADWLDLEEKANNSFFLSWHWINTWLKKCAGKPILVSTYKDNILVALGFLEHNIETRHRFLNVNQLWLNRCGNHDKDQIWIEHNDFLIDAKYSTKLRPLLAEKIFYHFTGVEELIIGVSSNLIQNDFAQTPFKNRSTWQASSYEVDFEKIPQQDYLQSLSKNTRQQITRSIRLFEQKYGDIHLQHADTIDNAVCMLGEAAKLHITNWQSKNINSGFSNPVFNTFHQQLLMSAMPCKHIDLICIKAGDQLIGYLYNFIYKNKAYFYLSALTKFNESKLKPGLVAHALVIDKYIKSGLLSYDFLAGDAQYKAQLSNTKHQFSTQCFYRNKLKLRIENIIRICKERLCKRC